MSSKNQTKSISQQITRIFTFGALALLGFYAAVFNLSLLYTENATNERRLKLIAPFHAQSMLENEQKTVKIDPLLTIYSDYDQLPQNIKDKYTTASNELESIHIEEDEYNIYHFRLSEKPFYAIEKIDTIEWNDFDFALFEILLFFTGLTIFSFIAWKIFTATRNIAYPFHDLTEILHNKDSYDPIELDVSSSIELADTVTAVNTYREKAKKNIEREKNFTRYISHEFRTPMSVIKGCISILKKQIGTEQKQLLRVHDAVNEMEALTDTFLILSRTQGAMEETTYVDESFVSNTLIRFDTLLENNETKLKYQLETSFTLNCAPTLLKACLNNLLNNAINCSLGGSVSLFISARSITVIDDGVGLSEKPRGYEGFGIGLLLVKDICDRYQWNFELVNNKDKGCTATLIFS